MSSHRVLLLAHGSSDPKWCETFEALARPSLDAIPEAAIAYMELSEPSLASEIARASRDGIEKVTVLPLFLAAGRHLRKDVPEMLAQLSARHGVITELAAPIGEHPLLAESISQIAKERLKN
ncbi:CbiX/SirB N-terminal domain-containing protein [Marinobacter sp. BGYM27]|uniref:sirohydrochlorin chelatase n=1 Tax=Marinobacter sp. BGYM27 TaxID=2975597 RepID=UPI0021A64C1C|nr:CbiX/SirB N-terminal domain-containing protein [Marinobacter sp. BGYM27]MDG5500425.1 CbiX/SirB N-terminal domain-containing protein [Marinobacter sp. BGYM27]